MLREARAARDDGRQITIFPEGTRMAPDRTRPYHAGIAAIYNNLDLPVVPVALNSGLFWPRRNFLRRPGTIVLEFLPAIAPGLDRKRFIAELHDRIETATRRLIAEGRREQLVDNAAE
jgi:1-acyl-sn-glycerol-3-phosphate acyltransferase